MKNFQTHKKKIIKDIKKIITNTYTHTHTHTHTLTKKIDFNH